MDWYKQDVTRRRKLADLLGAPYHDIPKFLGSYFKYNRMLAEAWTINETPFYLVSQADIVTAYRNPHATWQRTGEYSNCSTHVLIF